MEQHPSYDPSTDSGPGMPDPNYIQTTMFDERLPKAFHEVTVKAFPEALAHVGGLMGSFASVSSRSELLARSGEGLGGCGRKQETLERVEEGERDATQC